MAGPIDMTQLSALLAENMERLCRALFPQGFRIGTTWRANDGTELEIDLEGPGQGRWRDSGDAFELVRRYAAHGNAADAVRWARRWLGLDGGKVAPASDPPAPHLARGYLANAGSHVRCLGWYHDQLVIKDAMSRRWHVSLGSLGRRRTFVELFAGDAVSLATLFPLTPGANYRDRRTGWKLAAAQECLMREGGHAGLTSPDRAGGKPWQKRNEA